ncbi:MAG: hypothetical protein LAO20_09705 [Acidobacteriia bacterium]|nr:hypothetical protein [Terriglobia bacterium]
MTADQSPLRWLWHFCGALAALYVVDFWASVLAPQVAWLKTHEAVLICGVVAFGLSLLAGWRASRTWFFATAAAGLTVIFAMYAASV